MEKQHGQVTGIIWRGADNLKHYQELKKYAEENSLTVSTAAKQLLLLGLKQTEK